jgi:hypothetical protein
VKKEKKRKGHHISNLVHGGALPAFDLSSTAAQRTQRQRTCRQLDELDRASTGTRDPFNASIPLALHERSGSGKKSLSIDAAQSCGGAAAAAEAFPARPVKARPQPRGEIDAPPRAHGPQAHERRRQCGTYLNSELRYIVTTVEGD